MPKATRGGGALAGRRIIVTGAASGMGRAIAERFAREGAQLALIDSNDKGLKPVARRCRAFAAAGDLSSAEDVKRFVAQAARELKGIDGIVNTAGIYENLGFEKITPERWQRFIATNLTGPYLVCHSALPHLRRAKQATIVNFASTSFLSPYPGMVHYAASKGGVVGLTRALAIELAPKIRANAICPGTISTPMTRVLYPDEKALGAAAAARTPLGRIGEPEEIAETALFLTSPASSYITGVLLTVSGGSALY